MRNTEVFLRCSGNPIIWPYTWSAAISKAKEQKTNGFALQGNVYSSPKTQFKSFIISCSYNRRHSHSDSKVTLRRDKEDKDKADIPWQSALPAAEMMSAFYSPSHLPITSLEVVLLGYRGSGIAIYDYFWGVVRVLDRANEVILKSSPLALMWRDFFSSGWCCWRTLFLCSLTNSRTSTSNYVTY